MKKLSIGLLLVFLAGVVVVAETGEIVIIPERMHLQMGPGLMPGTTRTKTIYVFKQPGDIICYYVESAVDANPALACVQTRARF